MKSLSFLQAIRAAANKLALQADELYGTAQGQAEVIKGNNNLSTLGKNSQLEALCGPTRDKLGFMLGQVQELKAEAEPEREFWMNKPLAFRKVFIEEALFKNPTLVLALQQEAASLPADALMLHARDAADTESWLRVWALSIREPQAAELFPTANREALALLELIDGHVAIVERAFRMVKTSLMDANATGVSLPNGPASIGEARRINRMVAAQAVLSGN
jgi:hypothetical protein